jgi:hypothetical protein
MEWQTRTEAKARDRVELRLEQDINGGQPASDNAKTTSGIHEPYRLFVGNIHFLPEQTIGIRSGSALLNQRIASAATFTFRRANPPRHHAVEQAVAQDQGVE